MPIKKRKDIVTQVKDLLDEGNALKASFREIHYPAVVKNKNEMQQIIKFMTKSNAFISNTFGQQSDYYTQVQSYSSRPYRDEMFKVLGIVEGLYENLVAEYDSPAKSETLSLKYDIIIDELNLLDTTYEEVIVEINGTYLDHYYTSMYILVRKLLENLLYDCVQLYYGTQDVDKYYNTARDQHQGYGVLIESFNIMKNEQNFKTKVGDFDQLFIDLLKEFQEKGNRDAHSLFNLPHQDFIEERKDKLNNLIKKLDSVLQKLKN